MPDQPRSGTYLGFDYGQKHIGIAVGQTVSRTASPVCILKHSTEIDWKQIDAIAREWSPAGFVVGLPQTADGGQTAVLKEIKKFTRQLSARYQLPVHNIDEHLSSHAAKDLLKTSSARRMRRLDDAAAAVILQTWLDQQRLDE